MSKLPTIVHSILVEAYLDLNSAEMNNDVSTINLLHLLSQIKEGKGEINIMEASVLFEHFYSGYAEFKKTQSLDDSRLKSDPITYYDELHKQYYDDIDFHTLDKYDPTTLITMKASINCENFVLIHYIKSHFNIIHVDDMSDE